jgi:hypothetical protein
MRRAFGIILFSFSLLLHAQQPKPELLPLVIKRDTMTHPTILRSIVPVYQILKGNIFCRMEDLVTRKTGVWLKVGVTDKVK